MGLRFVNLLLYENKIILVLSYTPFMTKREIDEFYHFLK
jgi:hypothetical protein